MSIEVRVLNNALCMSPGDIEGMEVGTVRRAVGT